MATPKELAAAVSEHTGVPLATVVVHDRNLAEEGLRTAALRGRGITHVTLRDAANLLIAVAGSRSVKDSARTVRDYSALVTTTPMALGKVIRGVNFGDAIEALLEAIPTNRELFSGRETEDVATVSIYGPVPRAIISIRMPGKESHTTIRYDSESEPKGSALADLKFIAQFTQITLGHVGEAIRLIDG